jgi:hypothetical protein
MLMLLNSLLQKLIKCNFVVSRIVANISEESAASIFRVGLKMEAVYSEMSINAYKPSISHSYLLSPSSNGTEYTKLSSST